MAELIGLLNGCSKPERESVRRNTNTFDDTRSHPMNRLTGLRRSRAMRIGFDCSQGASIKLHSNTFGSYWVTVVAAEGI